jgi:hypothetical protein
MRRFVLPLLSAVAFTSSCSVDPQVVEPPKNEVKVTLPTLDIAPGDSFECIYTGYITDKELSVGTIAGHQAKGGHHITVYWTDSTKTGHAPCTDEEMQDWRMIGGADVINGGEPAIKLPPGVAYKVPAGKQLVAQVHYINPTGETYQATDDFALEIMDPKNVVAYTNLLTFFDPVFDITPNAETTSTSIVTVPQDLSLIIFGGHMHELGKHYKLERVDDLGNTLETLYETDWDPSYASHPPTKNYPVNAPMVLPQGTKVRMTCTWNNTTADDVTYPREMSVAFGFYIPDQGDMILAVGKH